jgi:tetratricopeptide (TPR) repeat protein
MIFYLLGMGKIITRSEVPRNSSFYKSKKFKIIASILIVLVIGASVAIIIYKRNSMLQSNNGGSQDANTAQENSTMLNKAMALSQSGDQDAAFALYDKAIASAKTDQDKSAFMIAKATSYYNSKDYDKALELAKQAEALDKNVNVFDFIATIYERKDDKPMALSYYSKAITLIKENSGKISQADLEYYEYKVTELSK